MIYKSLLNPFWHITKSINNLQLLIGTRISSVTLQFLISKNDKFLQFSHNLAIPLLVIFVASLRSTVIKFLHCSLKKIRLLSVIFLHPPKSKWIILLFVFFNKSSSVKFSPHFNNLDKG